MLTVAVETAPSRSPCVRERRVREREKVFFSSRATELGTARLSVVQTSLASPGNERGAGPAVKSTPAGGGAGGQGGRGAGGIEDQSTLVQTTTMTGAISDTTDSR